MLSDTLLIRLFPAHVSHKRRRQLYNGPQITHDTIMPSHSHGLVKIVVSDAKVLAPHTLGNMQMSCICCRQTRFGILGSEEIDGVNVTILFRQVPKVPFKGRLRCLRTRNLDSLAKCLQSLLLPENWGGEKHEHVLYML